MNLNKLEDQSFIFASNKDNPQFFFQGYCFIHTDYIYGDKGRLKYYEDTGLQINGGEDGCYVTVQSDNDVYCFSSDFYGYKKIFYYWTPEIWVVSNSIFLITEYLKRNKIFIKANLSQLQSIGIHRSLFFNQLYCTDTFVEGIKLLPVGFKLTISSKKYVIQKNQSALNIKSYEDGVSNFISIWTYRLAALIQNGIRIRSDLTGGIDSRTVFTLLNASTKLTKNIEFSPSLRSGKTQDNKDLTIASAIAELYDFPINETNISFTNRFNGQESFNSWKILCLGVYHPIYLPSYGLQPHIIALAGGGAENHRLFYRYDDEESFINSNASKLKPEYLINNFKAEMHTEMFRMKTTGSKVDLMTRHYREYRNRMHAGRSPQFVTSFNPLASKILDETAEFAGIERLKNGQVNFDIMASLLPSILDIPFDNPNKSLNDSRRKNLTVIQEWEEKPIGNVYIDKSSNNMISEKTASAFEFLYEDFMESLESKFVLSFFDKSFIDWNIDIIADAKQNRRFSHAIDGQGIAAIICGSLFD